MNGVDRFGPNTTLVQQFIDLLLDLPVTVWINVETQAETKDIRRDVALAKARGQMEYAAILSERVVELDEAMDATSNVMNKVAQSVGRNGRMTPEHKAARDAVGAIVVRDLIVRDDFATLTGAMRSSGVAFGDVGGAL